MKTANSSPIHVCWSLAIFGLLAASAPAAAQSPFRPGAGGGRPLDSTVAGEAVDPFSGSLSIVETDLVLPGNAGLDVRVQRVYGSAIYPGYNSNDLSIEEDSWAGIGWKLHFGRVINPDSTVSGATQIEMGDGGRSPLYTTSISPGWTTKSFWLYDRATHTLKLPNGLVYEFSHVVNLGGTAWHRSLRQVHPRSVQQQPGVHLLRRAWSSRWRRPHPTGPRRRPDSGGDLRLRPHVEGAVEDDVRREDVALHATSKRPVRLQHSGTQPNADWARDRVRLQQPRRWPAGLRADGAAYSRRRHRDLHLRRRDHPDVLDDEQGPRRHHEGAVRVPGHAGELELHLWDRHQPRHDESRVRMRHDVLQVQWHRR